MRCVLRVALATILLAICSSATLALRRRGAAARLDVDDSLAWARSSRPGSPKVIPWTGAFPYKTVTANREDWGERLLHAAAAVEDVGNRCGGFVTFGDFTWCAKAMAKEVAGAGANLYGRQMDTKNASVLEGLPAGQGLLGLSCGVRERDLWSELLSNRYAVPTELYDCYWKDDVGPMGRHSLRAADLGLEACPSWRAAVCYMAPYEARKVCVSSVAYSYLDPKGANLTFDVLSSLLRGRRPLSVFLRLGVQGGEWEVLEQLLASAEDAAKIRSLDVEANMMMYAKGHYHIDDDQEAERIERKVKTMERLAQKFAVVGSTIGSLFEAKHRELTNNLRANADFQATEPFVYARNKLPLTTFSISYVNRALI